MTIDEQLDRLSARHEALTQSVELLRLEGEEQNSRIDKQSQNIAKLVGLMESFANIVQSHERRLTDLEGD